MQDSRIRLLRVLLPGRCYDYGYGCARRESGVDVCGPRYFVASDCVHDGSRWQMGNSVERAQGG